MARIVKVKNTKGSADTWAGMQIQPGAYYQIESGELSNWQRSGKVLADVGSGDLVVNKGAEPADDISDVVEGWNWIIGNLSQTVTIQEEDPTAGTGSSYQSQSFELVVDQAAGTWKIMDVTFPFPISLFSASWINEALFNSDICQFLVAPDTITGTITSDIAATDTVITVSQTVVDNAKVGRKIKLYDGTNQDDMGRILSIDKSALTLTMEIGATNTFAAATPTYIQQTIEMLPNLYLKGEGRVELGKDVIGGSAVPANTVLRIRYKNVEGTTTGKVFSFIMEYKY